MKKSARTRREGAPVEALPPGRGPRVAGAALLVALGVLVLAPMLVLPLGNDHGSFATAAEVMGRGGALYREVWEIKPPGVYFLFRGAFALFGHSIAAVRLFDLLWTLAAAAVLALIGARLFSWKAGVLGAFGFLIFYALGFDFWHTAQCDGFTTLPLALAMLLALQAEEKQSAGRALASGALVGAAAILKFTVAGVLALPVLLAVAAREEGLRTRLLRAGSYLLGCGVAVGLVVLYLAWRGALADMLQIVFTWNAQYGGMRVGGALPKLLRFLLGGGYAVLKLIGALSLVGLAGLIVERRRRLRDWLVPLWGAAAFLGIVVQGKYFAYHWLPLLPPVGLLAGQGVAFVLTWLGRPFPGRQRKALTGVLAVAALAALAAGYWGQFRNPLRYLAGALPQRQYEAQFATPDAYFSYAADKEVAEYIRSHTSADDRIFVWGLEPLVYFLSDRRPATRFIHAVPLITPWSPPAWHGQMMAQLKESPPRLILLVHNDAQPWVTMWRGDSSSYLTMGQFPEFVDLVRGQYRPAMVIEDFEILERTSPAGR